jgi:hypothetical protein
MTEPILGRGAHMVGAQTSRFDKRMGGCGSQQFWQNNFRREWRAALGESRRGSPRHGARNSQFTYENSLSARKNSLFREQQGIACKLLKLLKDSPLS